jgi:hypothetical protein
MRYGTAEQNYTGGASSDGFTVTAPVSKPALLTSDNHTLFELSVQHVRANGHRDIVEVGWNVDRTVNGDDNPHLFVFRWVDGVPGTYNGSGFVPAVGATYTAGQSLAAHIGLAKQFEVIHIGTAWWIRYANTWVGAFPDSIWGTGVFPNSTSNQVFGELALGNDPSQTDMMSGVYATSTAGSLVDQYLLYDAASNTYSAAGASLLLNANLTDYTRWPAVLINSTSFRVGGPGGNEHFADANGGMCSGTGVPGIWGGFGEVCPYQNTSGGVPISMVANLQKDGTVPRNTCFPNFGKLDGQTISPIRVWVNTTYVKWAWFRDANCAGANYTFDYGVQVMPAGWTNLDHASLLRWSTPVTGH